MTDPTPESARFEGTKLCVVFPPETTTQYTQAQIGILTRWLRDLGLNSSHGINNLVSWQSGTTNLTVDLSHLTLDKRAEYLALLKADQYQVEIPGAEPPALAPETGSL